MHLKPLLLFLIIAAFASSLSGVFAQNVVGTWKGNIEVDTSKLPKPKDDSQRKAMEAGLASIKALRLILVLKSDKTYTTTYTGGPSQEKDRTSSGKWSQSGSTVTITPLKNSGKPVTGNLAKPQKLFLSPDGKKLTLTPPSQNGVTVKVVFRK